MGLVRMYADGVHGVMVQCGDESIMVCMPAFQIRFESFGGGRRTSTNGSGSVDRGMM